MSKRKTISVVTPCFNEEESIRECYEAVKAVFDQHLPNYDLEHIFCDNASTDRTVEILKQIAADDKSVKVIVNARNFGPMRSHFNGVRSASGDGVLLFMPADLQDPPEKIPEFVALWEQGYEVVYGIRSDRVEKFPMKKIRWLYYRMVSSATYLDMPPDVGDFQLVDRKVHQVFKQFDDFYPYTRAMAFEVGFKQIGVPYKLQERKRGMSKNRLLHLIDQGMNGLISYSTTPIRIALLFGMLIATLAVGFAVVNVVMTLFIEQGTPRGTPLLISALFFFAGVQLFFLGFLGEYLLAVYQQVRKRPVVVERERINFPDTET
ncbi:glycosyltransferase family 2 protein [Magnetospira thiophila]